MNTVDFLSYLRSLDIQVFSDGQTLHCNAPKGALTPTLYTEIQERKVEIIAFLDKNLSTTNADSINLVPLPRNRFFPLSFAQQRLWFLDQLIPNNAFYNIPSALRVIGSLNLEALEQTFTKIVLRHEALRTTFVMLEGQAVQIISPTLKIPITVVDLQSVQDIKRETQALCLMKEEAQRPFNLATGPLLRITLLRLQKNEHILLLNLHHIVSDGWSIGVLIRELAALYEAISTASPLALPTLPIQYADFAHWQRQWLQQAGKDGCTPLQTQLTYWRQQLDGISFLNLPTDRIRSANQTYRGTTQFLQLSESLSEALEALSKSEGATLFMTLLAAFQILLSRYTQQEDIVVGTPIANRNRSEIEPLIGFFVNSLVLRTNLSGNPTFLEVLNRVRKVALGAYAHQDLPFEKLVEELHPERNLNQNPLFQVVFALQNAPIAALELQGLTLSPLQFVDTGATRFDLEFHLWERAKSSALGNQTEGINGFVVYNIDLFEQTTIQRMLGHFQTLLANIVANPQTKIAELEILTVAERHQLLVEWNKTQRDYSKKLCVQQLFEAQVEQTPDAIALVFGTEQITYKELNKRSNQLAYYLKKNGVSPEILVGLCVENSIEMVVGILGILKAGGAYVPLDPHYPTERLRCLIEDTKMLIVLTLPQWRSYLGQHNSQVICLDDRNITQEIETNPICKTTTDNLAYVIYTSGTTGKPKGVEIEHNSLLNLIFWHQQTFVISPFDKVTQIAGIAFDACTWEIFPYLISGASIYFPNKEIKYSAELLRDWLVSNAITISFLPTPIAEKALLLDWSNTALRLLLTGGDKLSQYPLESHPFLVVNNYGPTENTVVTTSGILTKNSVKNSNTASTPTIGRPINNTQVYILDKYLQPVPIGVVGELYIAGDGLARGYLNNPDLTDKHFINNPFSNQKNAHFYKTGDLVRYQPDGNIEFLGRLDQQVKIRGCRIELAEIESLLNQHSSVQQTVVITDEDRLGEKRLVAYVAIHTSQLSHDFSSSKNTALMQEQVLQWQMLYDQTYKQSVPNCEPTFNIIGWNSSYNKQPIPTQQMKEWVNNQVALILALQPKRVLEIGCGTGLLLFRIAPYCTQYCGTDFSSSSLNYIRQQLPQLPQVTLLQKIATDFEGVELESFEAVVLNSVVQYFPSISYLMQVIEGAVKTLTPGGFIFIGDARSLPLLPAFHASVQLFQAESFLSREQLQERVKLQLFQETELVIDPDFFYNLKQHYPQISDVQIQLMRGRENNELTQFRYNVILYVGKEVSSYNHPQNNINYASSSEQEKNIPDALQGGLKRASIDSLNWQENSLTVSTIRKQLIEQQPEILFIKKIPNRRVTAAIKTVQWLNNTTGLKTVGQFKKALQEQSVVGVEPEDLWALDKLGYRVNLSWSEADHEGCYDALFVKQEIEIKRTMFPHNTSLRPWQDYANNPLQAKAARQLVPQLKAHLTEMLPEYMMPSAIVVLESLPMTANGKIDRRALPTPDLIKQELVDAYIAPRTAVEEVLVKIFSEVLNLQRVGVGDNFFELGGHSLLATQLVSRVRDAFSVELPLRSIFESPKIAQLSLIVESLKDSLTKSEVPGLVPIPRDSRRRKLSSLNQENE
ncbi:MAG: amino acid adenylation domain-containing protein [Coleofasciculaceae cyanobacterium]